MLDDLFEIRDIFGRWIFFVSNMIGDTGPSGDGDSGKFDERDMKLRCLSLLEKSTTGDLMMMGAEFLRFAFGVQKAN